MCARGGAARQAEDRAARVRRPSAARRGRRRPARSRRRRCRARWRASASTSAADADDAQAVAQPLHDRAGDEDAAFERVVERAVRAARRRWSSRLLRDATGLRAGVQQQEAAGAVGVLGQPGREAGLAEERRLLVAGDAGDRNRARRRSARVGADAGRRHDLAAARARGMSSSASSSSSQSPRVDVEQQRAAGVRCVGDVHARRRSAARSARCRWCRRRARRAAARVARARDVVEQPVELGAGEVGVEHQAGLARDQSARGPRRAARRRCAAVRRSCQTIALAIGLAGRAVPQHRRLALVGDADRRDVARR